MHHGSIVVIWVIKMQCLNFFIFTCCYFTSLYIFFRPHINLCIKFHTYIKNIACLQSSTRCMLLRYHKLNMASYFNISMSKIALRVFLISVDAINCLSEILSLSTSHISLPWLSHVITH